MHPWIRQLGKYVTLGGLAIVCAAVPLAGCAKAPAPKITKPAYVDIGLRKNLPSYLKDTVLERADLSNTAPMPVTTYGLVVNLRYSGDSNAPTAVRDWMIKEMYRHGMGAHRIPGYLDMTPERVLADKRTAVVVVGAYVPPGARSGQRVDAYCQALPQSNTASLSGGTLYQCELRILGANAVNPGGSVNKYIEARGPLFVNPAYALETPKPMEGSARAGARSATILGGGIVTADRALQLRLRTPQWNVSRSIEIVINTRFQAVADKNRQDGRGMCAAEAQDEGYLNLYVPQSFKGNWEHFTGIVNHLYLNVNPAVAAIKAQELAAEAKRPGALLEDISFAMEGLGAVSIPQLTPLLNDPSADVRYAMARAGAFLGDSASEDALIAIARTEKHPFRLNAILALGELPGNPQINRGLASCLDSEESLIRINAYRALANSGDPRIMSTPINDNFVLDVIESGGPPLIYATRAGEPRLAVFGSKTALRQPIAFSAFDTQLTIMTDAQRPNLLSIFYRGDELPQPVKVLSQPNVPTLAARLAGLGDEKLHFGYGDIIGMLQSMSDSGKVAAPFVLQDQPGLEDVLAQTPDTTSIGRAVGEPGSSGQQTPGSNPPPTVGVNAPVPSVTPSVRPN